MSAAIRVPSSYASSVLSAYHGHSNSWDEMLGPGKQTRPIWRDFAHSLNKMSSGEMEKRNKEISQQLQRSGVSYHVYGDSSGAERPWSLDPIPFLLGSDEWSELERGIIQRAELLDAILRDVYGKRLLIRDGLLPARFIYSHPGYQRECSLSGDIPFRMLTIYAADLVRSPDGKFRVVSDRGQNPSGYGYALENRLVLGKVFPSLFRHFGVHRLAPFFQSLRRGLTQANPVAQSQIVLLSSGEENETYFEQGYLASYLGIPLVQGHDLRFHEEGIRMESAEGAVNVGVILRRMDDLFCDSLEFSNNSLLGVPGLMEAVREKKVMLANALGSGLVNNSGLMAFLPEICRKVLGQELRLESTPTFWCGNAESLANVIKEFDNMVIKPLYQGANRQTWFCSNLLPAEKEELIARIHKHPHNYVGQHQLIPSTAPSWIEGRLRASSLVLRSFATAVDDSYRVMPGGLTRVSPTDNEKQITGQSGGISKDTWIITSEVIPGSASPEPLAERILLNRQSSLLPAYAAENLFWMGRYHSRLEYQIRLWREVFTSMVETQTLGPEPSIDWISLVSIFQSVTSVLDPDARSLEIEMLQSLRLPDRLGAIAYNQNEFRRTARTIRDRISQDMWQAVRSATQSARDMSWADQIEIGEALRRMDHTNLALSAIVGMTAESMTEGPVRRFLLIGWRLERINCTAKMLLAALGSNLHPSSGLLLALLSILDSLLTYRRRYPHQIQMGACMDLLVSDDLNPRSLSNQLGKLIEELSQVSHSSPPWQREVENLALQAHTAARLFISSSIGNMESASGNEMFEGLMAGISQKMQNISDLLTREVFSNQPAPQSLRAG